MQRYEKSFATGLQRDAFLGEHQRLEKRLRKHLHFMSFCASKSVRVSPMGRSDSHRWGGETLTGFEV